MRFGGNNTKNFDFSLSFKEFQFSEISFTTGKLPCAFIDLKLVTSLMCHEFIDFSLI